MPLTGQFLTGAGTSGLVGVIILAGVQFYRTWKRSTRAAPGETLMVTADRNAAINGLNNTITGLTAENERLRTRVQDLENRVEKQQDEIMSLRMEISKLKAYSTTNESGG